jgi:cell division protein FtsQ
VARAAVVSLPHARGRVRVSPRWLAVAAGALALAGGAYGVARQTSAFALDRVEVAGAPPAVRRSVRAAVAPLRGTSLLGLDGAELLRRVEALPTVVSAGYDRAFPHTLRLEVVPERPVAVVRQGAQSWLASARGRVMAPLRPHAEPALPRIWVPRATPVVVGGVLPADGAAAVARALALARRFPAHVAFAQLGASGLVFRLRSGLELRLGDPNDIRLKLAIAVQVLHRLPPGSRYVDVSVPGRPVAGGNPQVSAGG